MRDTGGNGLAWAVMLLTPLFFSTNLIFGRWTVTEVAPATLAFLRWGSVALVLLPFSLGVLRRGDVPWRPIALLSALGMVVCGAVVYLALRYTSATNATLIYTSSPVFVLLIERSRGIPLQPRKALGCCLAIVGVATIVFRGELDRLVEMEVNIGDALILACAIAWAGYSIAFRDARLSPILAPALFGLVAGAGALMLVPLAGTELLTSADMPRGSRAWTGILGIVAFSSLAAFGGYQFGLRRFGAQTTSIFMYLLPVYGVLLATSLLDEAFRPFHAAGIALVVGGVLIATLPRFGRH